MDITQLYIIFIAVIVVISLYQYYRLKKTSLEHFIDESVVKEQKEPNLCDLALDATALTTSQKKYLDTICKIGTSQIYKQLLDTAVVVNNKTLKSYTTDDVKVLTTTVSDVMVPGSTNIQVAYNPPVSSWTNLMKDECINSCIEDPKCNYVATGKPNTDFLGKCVKYEAGSTQLTVNNAFDVSKKVNSIEYSIEFYIKLNKKTNSWRNILFHGNSENMRYPGIWIIPNTNKLTIAMRTSLYENDSSKTQESFDPNVSIGTNQWTHIVFTISGRDIKFYINGELADTRKFDGYATWPADRQNLHIAYDYYKENIDYELGFMNWYPLELPEDYVKGISQKRIPLPTPWDCGIVNTPVRLNSKGNVECASTNGKDCLWKENREQCEAVIKDMPSPLVPLECTDYSDKNGWCKKAYDYLQEKYNGPCSRYADDSTNLPTNCLQSIWKQSGCTNKSTIPNDYKGWWKNQSKKVVEDDMRAWSTLGSETHRRACYGDDKSKWPADPQYETVRVNQDRGGADIACYSNGETADVCREKCSNDPNCKAYNYVHPNGPWGSKSGCCYKTTATPIVPSNKVDFYVKREPEVFNVVDKTGAYKFTKKEAEKVCKDLGAKVATVEQVTDAFNYGADWCSWGHTTTDPVYPMQRTNMPGCNNLPNPSLNRMNGFDENNSGNWNKGQYGVHCYGNKPEKGSNTKDYGILPFHQGNGTWNRRDSTIKPTVYSKWSDVSSRKPGENNQQWTARIYDAMTGDQLGTRKPPYEGGVNALSGYLGNSTTLNKDIASKMCENPCYWYYNYPSASQQSKDKIDKAGLCGCKLDGTPATNTYGLAEAPPKAKYNRRPIIDGGYPDNSYGPLKKGYYDILGQGFPNDYCRYVGDWPRVFFGCQLSDGTQTHAASYNGKTIQQIVGSQTVSR